MCAWGDCNRDFLEMQSHGLAVAGGQDKPSAFPFGGADGAENIGRRRPLVVRRRRTRPTLGPAARDLVLLPDARLIGEPDLYAGRIEALVLCDLIQAGGETFLKSSIAPSVCA
jgi:hypothetical protein